MNTLLEFMRLVTRDENEKFVFDIYSKSSRKTYNCSIELIGEEKKLGCTCPFGTYEIGRHNAVIKPCKHLKYALSILKFLGYTK